MLKKSIVLLLLLQFMGYAFAQDLEKVRFGVDLDGEMRLDKRYYEIRLNDTVYINASIVYLPEGTYQAEFWAPGYQLKTLTLDVSSDKANDFMVNMEKTEAYLSYIEEMPHYQHEIGKRKWPIRASVLLLAATGVCVFQTERLQANNIEVLRKYKLVRNAFQANLEKNSVIKASNQFNQMRVGLYTACTLSLASIAFSTWYTIHLNRKNSKPTYNRTSPFSNQLSLNMSINQIKFTWNI